MNKITLKYMIIANVVVYIVLAFCWLDFNIINKIVAGDDGLRFAFLLFWATINGLAFIFAAFKNSTKELVKDIEKVEIEHALIQNYQARIDNLLAIQKQLEKENKDLNIAYVNCLNELGVVLMKDFEEAVAWHKNKVYCFKCDQKKEYHHFTNDMGMCDNCLSNQA